MESLDLTKKLVDLNIKSKALDQIYLMSQVFREHLVIVMTKGKKQENENYENLFILLPPLPSLDGGVVANPPPLPQLFSL